MPTAPTGTTSLMTQTTSGIEPVFMPVYKRRRKVNPGDADVHVDFVDEVGDSFEEYIVYHPKFIEWMRVNGLDTKKRYTQEEIDELVAQSPYYKATANDVDWLMKVKMQGVHHLSRRQPLGRDDQCVEERQEEGKQRGQRDVYLC